ncbi:MAG: hypothetical protein WCH00_00725 [Candidatus Saccharibacteria bacterium]
MNRAGDTLVEVVFAFALLGVIIGSAYSGVIQAHRLAVSAQQRTQATLIASYESNALQAYRQGQPWNSSGGSPNFMNYPLTVSTNDSFCVLVQKDSQTQKNVFKMIKIDNANNCDNLAPYLKAPSVNKAVTIKFSKYKVVQPLGSDFPGCTGTSTPITDCLSIKADVVISWIDPYGSIQSVKKIVILSSNL